MQHMKKQPKLLMGIMAAIAVTVAVIISIVMTVSGESKDTYDSHIELAQRYLDELQYEQAIAEYEAAIAIDPQKPEAYLGLAEVYVAMDDIEKALDVLKEGYEQTQSTRIVARQGELEESMGYFLKEEMYTDEIGDEGLVDVMDYVGKWQKLIDELDMKQTEREYSFGNYYEISGFSIEIENALGMVEIRNDGYRDINISGVVLGDNREQNREQLEQDIWYCDYYGEDYDFYLAKKDDQNFYLWVFYSGFNNFNWCLANWYEGGDGFVLDAKLAAYDAYKGTTEPWKKAYISFILENAMNIDYWSEQIIEKYKLVNVNNDDIPEIYINFGSTAGGDMLCTYYDDSVIYQYMWNDGFSYMEGQNLFMDAGGHMDVYYDNIYTIENKQFVLLYSGEYGAEDNSNLQTDSNGNIIYNYYWNGVKVNSEEEYWNMLNEVYNIQQSKVPYARTKYSSWQYQYSEDDFYNCEQIFQAIKIY